MLYLKMLAKTEVVERNALKFFKSGNTIRSHFLTLSLDGMPHSCVQGKVIVGRSVVDESMLTGESLPVFKEEGLFVSTGTVWMGNVVKGVENGLKMDEGFKCTNTSNIWLWTCDCYGSTSKSKQSLNLHNLAI
ncbi:unnamed protein product [Lactuca saligna]|uniref:P-type ATPase A domain-containing protein n=1 Tax=Lactuca saligna TaxID=75948 RepID=A0AA35Z1L4_LACSI|nr:unnamed protein product [Lactuca saligna]